MYPKFLQAYQPVGPARAGPAKSDGTVLTSSWPLPSTKPWTHRKEPLHEYRIPRSISCVLPQSPLRPPLSHGLPHGVGSVLLPYISPWSPNSWISNPAVRITSCVLGPRTAVSGSFSGRWARYYLLPRGGCEDETNAVRCPEPRLAHSKRLLRVHWYGYYWSTALQLSSTHSLSLCGVLAARERIVILPMDEKDFE